MTCCGHQPIQKHWSAFIEPLHAPMVNAKIRMKRMHLMMYMGVPLLVISESRRYWVLLCQLEAEISLGRGSRRRPRVGPC